MQVHRPPSPQKYREGHMSESFDSRLARVEEKIDSIAKKVDDLRDSYVTRLEFEPVKRLVYSGSGVILLSVVVAILALVLKSHGG